MKPIKKSLILKVHKYLGKDGLHFFRTVKKFHKQIAPVLKITNKHGEFAGVHPIHLREGMTIRNFLRNQEECNDWNTDDFDNLWTIVVNEAIKL